MGTAVTNSTARHLVVVKYDVGVLVQTAYRTQAEATEAANRAWQHPQAVDVQVDYVANYRGRRVTKIVL